MNKYENAVDQLKEGIKTYINKKTDEIPCDRTFTALVTKVNSNGTYAVLLNGVEYNHIKTIGGTCYVNETVKVLVPQNNYNNMFILKAIEDTQGYKLYKFENPNDIIINSSGSIMKEYDISSVQPSGTQTGKVQILDEYYVTRKEEYRTNQEDGIILYKNGKENEDYPIELTNVTRDAINKSLDIHWTMADLQNEKKGVLSIGNSQTFSFIKVKGTVKVTDYEAEKPVLVDIDNSDSYLSILNAIQLNYNKNGTETPFEGYIVTNGGSPQIVAFWYELAYSQRVPENTSAEVKIKEIVGYKGTGHQINVRGSIKSTTGDNLSTNDGKIMYLKNNYFGCRTALFCYSVGDSRGITPYTTADLYNGKLFCSPYGSSTPYVLYFNIHYTEGTLVENYPCFPSRYVPDFDDNKDNYILQMTTNIPIFESADDAWDYCHTNDDELALNILSRAINYKETEVANNEIFSTTLLMADNSKAKVDIELLLDNILSEGEQYTDFDVYYYVNGVRQSRIPKGKLLEGDNIVRLMYVVESDVSARKVFSVLLKPKTGIINLNTKQELVTITGNGLLDQTFWSGDIDLYDYFNLVEPINPDIVYCDDEVSVVIVERPNLRSYTWGYVKNHNITWQEGYDEYVW